MIVPCEITAKSVVPTIRAMVAKELNQSYNMKQNDIANLLGITQSAVSQYLSKVRGKALDLDGVQEVEIIIKDLTHILTMGSPVPKTICQKYCEACRIIRQKRMLCKLHGRLDPKFDTTDCDVCMPPLCF